MQINNLIPKTKNKKTMTVGRGGKRGKTSGRGTKGQNSRSGHKKRPELRDFIKRIPKLRGRGVNANKTIETKPIVVNIADIESAFEVGVLINAKSIIEKKLVSIVDGRIPKIKILSNGDITKKLNIEGVQFSKSVKEKIEKAGGSIK